MVSITSAPRTLLTALITWPRWSMLVHSTVIWRRVLPPLAPTVSTATIAPPARVIAAVTLPSTPPGRSAICTLQW